MNSPSWNIQFTPYNNHDQDLAEGEFLDVADQQKFTNEALGLKHWESEQYFSSAGNSKMYYGEIDRRVYAVIHVMVALNGKEEHMYQFNTSKPGQLEITGKVTGPYAKALFETLEKRIQPNLN